MTKYNVTYDISPHARIQAWYDVTLDEMKVFIALLISTGLVQKASIEAYWSTDCVIATEFFNSHMSLKRFQLILSKFHLSFDEATCPFKGRLRFKVYNPMKPTKYGIKIYEVCKSESGYLLGFIVYTANPHDNTYYELADISPECTLTTRLVCGLLAFCGLIHQGHHVFLDNYYVSPELFEELQLLGTGACGTVRTNRRGFPMALRKAAIRLTQGKPSSDRRAIS